MHMPNDERTMEDFLQHHTAYTNDRVAGYTLIDDDVRSGFRRLFAALRAVMSGRQSGAKRGTEAPAIQVQTVAK